MGHINEVVPNMNDWIKKFDLKNYVETGIGEGSCLSYALQSPFQKFYSVEIHEQIYTKAKSKFETLLKGKQKNYEIFLGNSYKILPRILEKLNGNTLFFLDAHYPGINFINTARYESEPDYNTRIPCEKEIEVISSLRDTTNDIIIIDDLRLYMPGPYHGGPNPIPKRLSPTVNADFLYQAFNKTHKFTIDYQSQGYMIITPKRTNNE